MRGGGYESQGDRDNEETFRQLVESSWMCRLRKLPVSYRVDYMVTVGDDTVAWIEFKARSQWYSTMIMSLSKFLAGQDIAQRTGCKFLIAYSVGGDVRYGEFTKAEIGEGLLQVRWGGRDDRGDSQDAEPVVLIPLEKLKVLKVKP